MKQKLKYPFTAIALSVIFVFSVLAVIYSAVAADNASLKLTSEGACVKGQICTTKLYLATGGNNVDFIRARIDFPITLMEVSEIKLSSANTLQTDPKNFDNVLGQINLGLGIFYGSPKDTELATIKFLAKQNGTAELKFVSGTKVLSNGADLTYTSPSLKLTIGSASSAPTVVEPKPITVNNTLKVGKLSVSPVNGVTLAGYKLVVGVLPEKYRGKINKATSKGFFGDTYQIVQQDLKTKKNVDTDLSKVTEITVGWDESLRVKQKISTSKLVLTRWNRKTGKWDFLKATIDTKNNVFKIKTKQIGVYGIQIKR